MEEKKEKSLIESITILTKLIEGLRSRRYLEMVDKPKKFLFYNFISGVANGVGAALGATIILAVVIWILSKLMTVPVVGDWIVTILNYIQKTR